MKHILQTAKRIKQKSMDENESNYETREIIKNGITNKSTLK